MINIHEKLYGKCREDGQNNPKAVVICWTLLDNCEELIQAVSIRILQCNNARCTAAMNDNSSNLQVASEAIVPVILLYFTILLGDTKLPRSKPMMGWNVSCKYCNAKHYVMMLESCVQWNQGTIKSDVLLVLHACVLVNKVRQYTGRKDIPLINPLHLRLMPNTTSIIDPKDLLQKCVVDHIAGRMLKHNEHEIVRRKRDILSTVHALPVLHIVVSS